MNATAADADSWAWMKGAALIPGATGVGNAATFVKASAVLGDAGSYSVRFTNAGGSISTTTAAVTVNPRPTAPVVTSNPQNVAINVGANFTLTSVATGAQTWVWLKNGAATSNTGSGNTATMTKNAAAIADSGQYSVKFTNATGSTNSGAAVVTVTQPVPSIVTHPKATSVVTGMTVLLTSSATNASTWAWHKDGVAMVGKTGTGNSAAMSKDAADATDAGSYVVKFTNNTGTTTSNAAVVTIT